MALNQAPGAARHAPPGCTWRLGDRKTNKGRVRRGVAWSCWEGMHHFVRLEWRSTLVPLNIVGHFGGFRAVIRMNVRLGLQRSTRHLSRPAQKNQHTILSSRLKAEGSIATLEECPPPNPHTSGAWVWEESLHWHCFSRRDMNWFWELMIDVRAPYFFSSSLKLLDTCSACDVAPSTVAEKVVFGKS